MGSAAARRRAAACLLVVVGALGVPDRPALAYDFNECKWGDVPAVATYELQDSGSPSDQFYRTFTEDAIAAWNSIMDGRLKYVQWSSQSTLPADFSINSGDYGSTEDGVKWVGRWSPTGCWTDAQRWAVGGIIKVNKQRLETFGADDDPTMIRQVNLHELGHNLGLGHTQGLHTTPPPSRCNIMWSPATPFLEGHECQGMGSFLKPDDIAGAFQRYQPPDTNPNDPDPGDYIPGDLCTGDWFC